MSEKVIEFEDGSVAIFTMEEGRLELFVQARHLGKEIKTTSTTVRFTEEETKSILEWLEKWEGANA